MILHVERSLIPAALDSWVFSFAILTTDTISNLYLFECLLHKWQYGKKNQRKLELAWTLMSSTPVVSNFFFFLARKLIRSSPDVWCVKQIALSHYFMEGMLMWVQLWKSVCECGCMCVSLSSARTEHLSAWGWVHRTQDYSLKILDRGPPSHFIEEEPRFQKAAVSCSRSQC